MNKIFKVIWSKSKQCYVVVSEMAKNTTGKKKIVVAGILATLMVGQAVQVDAIKSGGNKTGAILIWGNTGGAATGDIEDGIGIGQGVKIGGRGGVATGRDAESAGNASAYGW